jgi:hypothetical protein
MEVDCLAGALEKTLQDIAIDNGWGKEYLEIAKIFP